MPLSPARARTRRSDRVAHARARARAVAALALAVRSRCAGSGGRTCRGSGAARASPSCAMMSRVTAGVAVAVSARTGTPPKRRLSPARLRYAGRKSWPHWLMQCASSTAIRRRSSRHSARRPTPRAPRAPRSTARTRRPQARDAPRAARRARSVEFRYGRAQADLGQRVDLVLHQRDERRDHQRRAAEQPRRDLIGERLAGAGRHDADAVAAGQHRVDDLLLAGAERFVAERRRAARRVAHRPPPAAAGRARQLVGAVSAPATADVLRASSACGRERVRARAPGLAQAIHRSAQKARSSGSTGFPPRQRACRIAISVSSAPGDAYAVGSSPGV